MIDKHDNSVLERMRNLHWSTRAMVICGVIYLCCLIIIFGNASYQCLSTAWTTPTPIPANTSGLLNAPFVGLYSGAVTLIALMLIGIAGWRWRAIGIMLMLLFAALVLTLLGILAVPTLPHAVLHRITGKQCPLHPMQLHQGNETGRHGS